MSIKQVIILSMGYITEKRADHSLRDEQICSSPLSFLCAVAPRFSVDIPQLTKLSLATVIFQLNNNSSSGNRNTSFSTAMYMSKMQPKPYFELLMIAQWRRMRKIPPNIGNNVPPTYLNLSLIATTATPTTRPSRSNASQSHESINNFVYCIAVNLQ